MDLFFAGSQCPESDGLMMHLECNRLMSQLNDRSLISKWVDYKKQNPQSKSKIFIDSGAYTASTQGTIINIDEYIAYLDTISDWVDIIAPLDVIPTEPGQDTSRQSMDNYKYMLQHMKHPEKLIPVYHQGEHIEALEDILKLKPKYMALGGLVGATRNSLDPFFNECFHLIQKYEKLYNMEIKVHAFGMTSKPLLNKYKFASADSTSFIMEGSRGSIMTPYGNFLVSEVQEYKEKSKETLIGTIDVSNKDFIGNQPQDVQDRVRDYIESLPTFMGIEMNMKSLATNYKARVLANVYFLKKWSSEFKYRDSYTTRRTLFMTMREMG